MSACRKPSFSATPARLTWLVLCLSFISLAAVADETAVVRQYSLGQDLVGQVFSDGSLTISTQDTHWQPLVGRFVFNDKGQRRRFARKAARPYFHLVTEGIPGGHRGFSASADDDGDGLVDEDPLDGLDNDEDGKTDEDFAAISDAMTVVGRAKGAESFHLECYGWAYQHLRSALFTRVAARAAADPAESSPAYGHGHWHLSTDGSPWIEVDAVSRRHNIGGRPELERTTAFVSQVDNPEPPRSLRDHSSDDSWQVPCDPDRRVWLGVVALGNGTRQHQTPLVIDERDLIVSMAGQPISLAICVAPSWPRLNNLLVEAQRVYRGVTDPVDQRQARWIAPALCSPCRLSDPPEFGWKQTGAGTFAITAELSAETAGLIDPDLLHIGDLQLGSPSTISWRPLGGELTRLAWSCMERQALDRTYSHLSDPYGDIDELLGHDATGELVFEFGADMDAQQGFMTLLKSVFANPAEVVLSGCYLDGRPFQTPLEVYPSWEAGVLGSPTSAVAATDEWRADPALGPRQNQDPAVLLAQPDRQPVLAPELLENYPNPFRDMTWIRFRIPQTMGEAFVWEDNEQPVGLDLDAAIPWPGGQPRVSVKIYSMTGQELALLHSSMADDGETIVQWSGTDSFGRPVASGTYFCKLQIDDWSVTKRLVFLR